MKSHSVTETIPFQLLAIKRTSHDLERRHSMHEYTNENRAIIIIPRIRIHSTWKHTKDCNCFDYEIQSTNLLHLQLVRYRDRLGIVTLFFKPKGC